MDLGKNLYTQVSINKIIEILSQIYGVHVGRRRVFQCLRCLEDNGLITRRRRYWRLDGGLIRSRPSLWSFPLKGINWLAKRSVEGAALFRKNMILWLKKKDGRFPTEQDFYAPLDNQKGLKDIQRFERMAEGVAKDIT